MSPRQSPYDPGVLRVVAIRLQDAEPITRRTLQYDFLKSVFDNTTSVFTDPWNIPGPKLTFRDLYVSTLAHATKASKALRDKMMETPQFGTAFAMLSLVVNVGRIPSTMSFFPEMTTKLRTYHPVPCLHTDPGNLQDAPRIKHIIKSCFLESEVNGLPTTPAEVISLARSGRVPPTTVVNLMTVLSSHLSPVSEAHSHFPVDVDFLDLFLDWSTSSQSRASAFLWLCYHYLETPSGGNDDNYDDEGPTNPFTDNNLFPDKLPALVSLTAEESALENQETESEINICKELLTQREDFLKTMMSKSGKSGKDAKKSGGKDTKSTKESQTNGNITSIASTSSTPLDVDAENGSASAVATPPVKKRPSRAKPKDPISVNAKKVIAEPKARKGKGKSQAADVQPSPAPGSPLRYQPVSRMISEDYDGTPEPDITLVPLARPGSTIKIRQNVYPRQQQPLSPPLLHHQAIYQRTSHTPEPLHRYSPYKHSSSQYTSHRKLAYPRDNIMPDTTMLQHAWTVITTSNPLLDSDEEMPDDDVRQDYDRRVHILNRLRGKATFPKHPRTTDAASDGVDVAH